jgi:hypothetical protein
MLFVLFFSKKSSAVLAERLDNFEHFTVFSPESQISKFDASNKIIRKCSVSFCYVVKIMVTYFYIPCTVTDTTVNS